MEEKPEETDQPHPERPLECGECRKPIKVHYHEIIGDTVTHTGMCSECPQLQKKLRGISHEEIMAVAGSGVTGLVCGNCGAILDEIRVSNQVGCSDCYEVFGDLLINEMMNAKKISPAITKKSKSVPLHIGRSPGEKLEISPSLELIALNEALEETLKHEDYEQAAWLRDQIKAITEESKEDHAPE